MIDGSFERKREDTRARNCNKCSDVNNAPTFHSTISHFSLVVVVIIRPIGEIIAINVKSISVYLIRKVVVPRVRERLSSVLRYKLMGFFKVGGAIIDDHSNFDVVPSPLLHIFIDLIT